MNIAVISDIHSNIHAFKAVVNKINSLSVDSIWCCGDITGYYAFPVECIDLVKRLNIFSVLGNHDHAVISGDTAWFNELGKVGISHSRNCLGDEDIVFLKKLPKFKFFKEEGVSFYVAHGSPRDNLFEYVHPWFSNDLLKEIFENVKADVVFLGHTHVQMEVKIDDKFILNPGSVGQPRDGISKSSFLVFDTVSKKADFFRVDYDISAAAKGIVDNGLPKGLSDRLFSGK